MSFAYLSHVSLILKTKKIVKLLGKTIGGGLKKMLCGLRRAREGGGT